MIISMCLCYLATNLPVSAIKLSRGNDSNDIPNIRLFFSFLFWSQYRYSITHLLVVDDSCVMLWTQSAFMVPKQNTRNIYHKQMNNREGNGAIDLTTLIVGSLDGTKILRDINPPLL